MRIGQISRKVFLFIALFYVVSVIMYRLIGREGKNYQQVIGSDGRGHYDYLPYFFIQDYAGKQTFDPQIHTLHNNQKVNKYYIGTAISEAPFFTLAWIWCKLTGVDCNGFSMPFQLMISLAGLFYFLASLYFLHKLLMHHFGVTEVNSAATLLVFSIGSTILFYTVVYVSFSHVYTFFWVAFFFWQVSKISRGQYALKTFVFCFLAMSMIVVIRPVNILVLLFIPVFFDQAKDFAFCVKNNVRNNLKHIIVGVGAALIPVVLQCLAWYAQCGSFFIWSYKNEGFNFTSPEVSNFLFSYRKGLFVYTPLLLVSLFGFFFLYKQSRWKFWWTFIGLVTVIYVLSSWWCWHYAGGLGMRPMTDFLIVFIILFAYILQNVKMNIDKWWIATLTGIAISFNLVFSYQFYKGILNPYSMDAKKFWFVFLKTGKEYEDCLGGMNDVKPYAPNGFDTLFADTLNFNDRYPKYLIAGKSEFPLGLYVFHGRAVDAGRHYFRIRMKRNVAEAKAGKNIYLVIASNTVIKGKKPFYDGIRLKEYSVENENEWIESEYTITYFNNQLRNQDFVIYIYNPNLETMYIDDIIAEAYVAKEK